MNEEIKGWIAQFDLRRRDLLSMAIFTAINFVLRVVEANVYFLFSATIPQLAFDIGRELNYYINNAYIIGLVVALLLIGAYFACWYFSQKHRWLIVVATGLFLLDCLVFGYLLIEIQMEVSYLIDIFFHGWILYSLIRGVLIYLKLRKISKEDIEATFTEVEISNVVEDNMGESIEEELNTQALRIDDKKGRIIIETGYQGLNIIMKRSYGLTELIIDGNVYAEQKGLMEASYLLSAQVSNVKVTGESDMSRLIYGIMRIYVNDEVIAEKKRFY